MQLNFLGYALASGTYGGCIGAAVHGDGDSIYFSTYTLSPAFNSFIDTFHIADLDGVGGQVTLAGSYDSPGTFDLLADLQYDISLNALLLHQNTGDVKVWDVASHTVTDTQTGIGSYEKWYDQLRINGSYLTASPADADGNTARIIRTSDWSFTDYDFRDWLGDPTGTWGGAGYSDIYSGYWVYDGVCTLAFAEAGNGKRIAVLDLCPPVPPPIPGLSLPIALGAPRPKVRPQGTRLDLGQMLQDVNRSHPALGDALKRIQDAINLVGERAAISPGRSPAPLP